MNNEGSALHALLIDLRCPCLGDLTPEGLDWMFEVQGCDTFLHWIVDNLGAENVVNDQDIAAFSKLPSEKLLRGPILDAALSCLGVDSEMSEHQLECQVAQLEEEIQLQEECREKLEKVKERLGDQSLRVQAKSGQMEHLLERAERDERRRQEQLLSMNSTYNESLSKLTSTVQKVSEYFQTAKIDQDDPQFISSISIDKMLAVDTSLDEELKKLMNIYFEVGQSDTKGTSFNRSSHPVESLDVSKKTGRTQEQYDILVSEVERLSISFCQSEMNRVILLSEEAGLKASINALTIQYNSVAQSKVPATPIRVKPEIIESREELEQQILVQIGRVASFMCDEVLGMDYKAKMCRSRSVIKKMEYIRDILLHQTSKWEILSLVLKKEMKEVGMVKDLFEEIGHEFKEELSNIQNFKTAMKSLKINKGDANLIPSDDLVMLGAHSILLKYGKVGHLATYSSVNEAVEELEKDKIVLINKLEEVKNSKDKGIDVIEGNLSKLLKLLNISDLERDKTATLAPSSITDGIRNLDLGWKELQYGAMKLLENWDRDKNELKTKHHLQTQRNVWVDFLVKPQILTANVKSLRNIVKD